MFRFPYFTLQQLKNGYPSKAKGRSWKAELRYRNECSDIIQAIGPPLHITPYTVHKGVVLLHRCLTRLSSTEFEKLDKWALATACVFLATKIDSTYHSLVNITHVAYRALRDMQRRPYDAEYFNPDGSPGNPAFLHNLAQKVRDAEMALIFAINFDFGVEVPTSSVIWQMRELGLDEAAANADPRVFKIRTMACSLCSKSLLTANCVMCLLFPPRQLALGAISAACKQQGYSIQLWGRENQWVPTMTAAELAEVEGELMKKFGGGGSSSRLGTPAPSGLSGGTAAAATAGGASGSSMPGTPAGPSAAAAADTPAGTSTATEAAPAATAAGEGAGGAGGVHDGTGSSRCNNSSHQDAAAAAGRQTSDQVLGVSTAAAAAVVGREVGGSSLGAAAAVERQDRTTDAETAAAAAAAAAAEDDAGLADEWFQLAAGVDNTAAAVDPKAGFRVGVSGAAAAATAGASQVVDGSAMEANTVGPRMNNPSPNSIDSLTGPKAAAAAARQAQQQQQQRKRRREDVVEDVWNVAAQRRRGDEMVGMLPKLR